MKKIITTTILLIFISIGFTYAVEPITEPAEIIGLDDDFENTAQIKSIAHTIISEGEEANFYHLRTFINKSSGEILLTQVYLAVVHSDGYFRNYEEALLIGGIITPFNKLDYSQESGMHVEGSGATITMRYLEDHTEGFKIKFKSERLVDTVVNITGDVITAHLKTIEEVQSML